MSNPMIPTPQMKTTISRNSMFATVVVEYQGKTALTTTDRNVKASDLEVENLKRSFAHLPRIKDNNEK